MTKLEELKAALEAATPGEWGVNLQRPSEVRQVDSHGAAVQQLIADTSVVRVGLPWKQNAEFIALAHNMVPQLLEAVEALYYLSELAAQFPEELSKDHYGVTDARAILEKLK